MSTDSNAETRQAVKRFLEDYRDLIAHWKPYISPRDKNQAVLIELGLTLKDQWRILQELSVEDYVSGPEEGRTRRSQMWVFGVTVKSVELYIKLQILEYVPKDTHELVRTPVCISFHPAERPLRYPLK